MISPWGRDCFLNYSFHGNRLWEKLQSLWGQVFFLEQLQRLDCFVVLVFIQTQKRLLLLLLIQSCHLLYPLWKERLQRALEGEGFQMPQFQLRFVRWCKLLDFILQKDSWWKLMASFPGQTNTLSSSWNSNRLSIKNIISCHKLWRSCSSSVQGSIQRSYRVSFWISLLEGFNSPQ